MPAGDPRSVAAGGDPAHPSTSRHANSDQPGSSNTAAPSAGARRPARHPERSRGRAGPPAARAFAGGLQRHVGRVGAEGTQSRGHPGTEIPRGNGGELGEQDVGRTMPMERREAKLDRAGPGGSSQRGEVAEDLSALAAAVATVALGQGDGLDRGALRICRHPPGPR